LSLPLPRAEHEHGRSWRRAWGAWATLGVAVAAAGTGLALRLVARSEDERANDLALTYDEAMGHYDRARSQTIAADVLLGVAAAAAVVSGVLLYRYARGGRGQAPRVVVRSSGLGVRFGAAAW
jgi:hypothetical protein